MVAGRGTRCGEKLNRASGFGGRPLAIRSNSLRSRSVARFHCRIIMQVCKGRSIHWSAFLLWEKELNHDRITTWACAHHYFGCIDLFYAVTSADARAWNEENDFRIPRRDK